MFYHIFMLRYLYLNNVSLCFWNPHKLAVFILFMCKSFCRCSDRSLYWEYVRVQIISNNKHQDFERNRLLQRDMLWTKSVSSTEFFWDAPDVYFIRHPWHFVTWRYSYQFFYNRAVFQQVVFTEAGLTRRLHTLPLHIDITVAIVWETP